MSSRRVVVTGLGQVTPHGRDVAAGYQALMQGRSAIRLNTVGEAPHAVQIASGVCEDFDAAALLGRGRAVTMDRFSQLTAAAGLSAWQDAGLAPSDALTDAERESACVMWGVGGGGLHTMERSYHDLFLRGRTRISPLSVVMGMHNAAASHLAMMFGLGGACFTYSVACASSAVAIAEAARRIRGGECQVAVAGGCESALPYGAVKAWQSMRVIAEAANDDEAASACRPFDRQRRGLVLAEGAAALVLEDRDHALARGARIYAELAGAGTSCDHTHLTAPDAQGQLRALRAALAQAEARPGELGYVNAHGTATTEGDPVEIDALRLLLGDGASRVAVSATKSLHGHLMGAAGAIGALVTVMAVHTGSLPPTAHLTEVDPACDGLDHVMGAGRSGVDLPLALSNSFAFGGSNMVLAFRRHAA